VVEHSLGKGEVDSSILSGSTSSSTLFQIKLFQVIMGSLTNPGIMRSSSAAALVGGHMRRAVIALAAMALSFPAGAIDDEFYGT
jgi:hypothetical protein